MSRLWGVWWMDHLLRKDCLPVIFKTRKAARAFAEAELGYIKHRPDLRRAPHNWRMPVPVRVTVEIAP